jgi:hypothetical protein
VATLDNGSSTSTTFTITPVCLPTLTLSKSSCTAGDVLLGTVTLSIPAPATSELVTLSASDSSVTVPSAVYFAAGQTTKTFYIPVSATLTSTDTPTITASRHGASSQQTLTINPENISSVTLSPSSITAGYATQVTVNLSQPTPPAGLVVTLSGQTSGAPFQSSLVIGANETSGTFTIFTGATAYTSNASFTVTATAPNGSTGSATCSVTARIRPTLTLSKSSCTAGDVLTGTVTLSAPAPATSQKVILTASDGSVSIPTAVYFDAGQTVKTFYIPVSGTLTSTDTPTITASCNGFSSQQSLTIQPENVVSVTTVESSVKAGYAIHVTVNVSQLTPHAGLVLTLSGQTATAPFQSTLVLGANETSGTFTIFTVRPISSATSVTITATAPNGTSQSTQVAITP